MAESFRDTVIEALEAGKSPAQVALQVSGAADRAVAWLSEALLQAESATNRAVERELVLADKVRTFVYSSGSEQEIAEAYERWKRMRYGGADPAAARPSKDVAGEGHGLDGRGDGAPVDRGAEGAGSGGDGASGAP